MPTYEYVCKKCGKRFDLFQPFSAKPLKQHEACGGEVQRVIHPRGIVFKGSGFYATDSRSKASSSTSSGTEAPTKKPATDTESKAGSSSAADKDR
jgi:putative FmdB family regulatory protein